MTVSKDKVDLEKKVKELEAEIERIKAHLNAALALYL